MTRNEFITYMTNQALSLRDNIIKAEGTANAPPAALLALIADPTRFVNLEMAALESAGILQPENGIPPISDRGRHPEPDVGAGQRHPVWSGGQRHPIHRRSADASSTTC